MSKFSRFSRIQVDPVSFNSLEVVICGHIGVELDRCGGVFLQVTIEMLDPGKMTLAWVSTVSRYYNGTICDIDSA